MDAYPIHWHSLRTRITAGVLAAVVCALWVATFAISYSLREEMEAELSAQQFSVVSLLADDVERSIQERVRALEASAARIDAALLGDAPRLQAWLEAQPVLVGLFNWGVLVTDAQGTTRANLPVEFGRLGVSYAEVPVVRRALDEQRSIIGEALVGKTTRQPLLPIAVPVRSPQGKVLGTLIGLTNLAAPNFLDDISANRFGRRGGYLVSEPATRTFIAATDKTRVMQPGPPPGVNPVYDRYMAGHEGSGIARSSRGVVELSSNKRIPSTGWMMHSVLPAEEAFAPIDNMQRLLLGITVVLTLLAGGTAWWWLRRELAPLTEAAALLRRMGDGQAPRQPLPVRRADEIGQLAGAFNGLLAAIVAEEAKAAEHLLNERVKKIVSLVPGVLFQCRLHADGRLTLPYVSDAIQGLCGLTPEALGAEPARFLALLHAEDREAFKASLRASARSLAPWRSEFRMADAGGALRWLLVDAAPEQDAEGTVLWHGFITDITRMKQVEGELRIAAATFDTQQGVVITDARGVILRVNRAFSELTGYAAAEAVGRTPALLQSGRHDAAFYRSLWECLLRDGEWRGELWNRHASGEIYPELLNITAVKDSAGQVTNYVGVFNDISRLKASEAKLEFLAHHDSLTQLPNRLLFTLRLEHSIAVAQREGTRLALLMLDLDRFKDVNDSYGHIAGDELLLRVAQRLTARLRGMDTVARLGGDEFTVLLEKIASPEDAAAVSNDIIATLGQPLRLTGGIEVHIGASIGISIYPDQGTSATELLQHADAALYRAKAEGRGRLKYFSGELTRAARQRIELEGRLRRAIQQGELEVHFQPQADIASGRIIGAEALVRWRDPQHGMVLPGEFIPVAEATGLIEPLGAWVLQETCRQGQRWIEAGLPPLTLAVNLSPHQFQRGDIGERVTRVLAETGFPAARLELELTESALMEREDQAAVVLSRLQAIGVRLAIDDFGTGYSSLAYLKRFPLDVLKIDKSFVEDIPRHQDDMEIAAAVVALAHSLQLRVLAEGVETPEQLAFLRAQGCDGYQGYLLSPPLPAAQFERWLGAQHAVATP